MALIAHRGLTYATDTPGLPVVAEDYPEPHSHPHGLPVHDSDSESAPAQRNRNIRCTYRRCSVHGDLYVAAPIEYDNGARRLGMVRIAHDNSAEALQVVAEAAGRQLTLGVEVDIQATSDGLVLHHDDFIAGSPIFELTTAQAKARAVSGSLVTLAEGLDLLAPVSVINLEIKDDGYTDEVIAMAYDHLLKYAKSFDSIVISSFCPTVVRDVKVIDSRFQSGLLIDEAPGWELITVAGVFASLRDDEHKLPTTIDVAETVALLEEVGADYLNPYWTDLSAALLQEVTGVGKQLIPWTVNDLSLIAEITLNPAVAHVITDFPSLVFPALRPPIHRPSARSSYKAYRA